MKLAEMTTLEAAAAARVGGVVAIPIGAVEQHGPALPLGTDILRAEAVAERVAAAFEPAKVVIGPTMALGVSPHHLAFAGTISLRPATFAAVVREYVECLAGAVDAPGWRRFLLITGHGGNNSALGTVAQDLLADRRDIEVAWTPITALAPDVVASLAVSEVHGHGGEAETAQMLAIAPELVRADALAAGTTRLDELDALGRLARVNGPLNLTLPYDHLSASGILGDPRSVTEQDGNRILNAACDRIVDFVRAWLAIE